MSNRTGKREREARKRHRRAVVDCSDGAAWARLKLGRKKYARHLNGWISAGYRRGKAALPVIEAEPREQTRTGAPTVGSEPV
jgi:hypothetical protein